LRRSDVSRELRRQAPMPAPGAGLSSAAAWPFP
jgi:hypothetical protein